MYRPTLSHLVNVYQYTTISVVIALSAIRSAVWCQKLQIFSFLYKIPINRETFLAWRKSVYLLYSPNFVMMIKSRRR
jgi:hypothetical protein